jgi:polyhydroxyalkanoate synthesis regulator phasin
MMTTHSKTETNSDTVHDEMYSFTRKILLAAIGAAALAHDEIGGFVERLSERGELAEKDARKLLKEIIERRNKIIEERKAEFRQHQTDSTTQAEVDELKAKISELNKKIEELKKG